MTESKLFPFIEVGEYVRENARVPNYPGLFTALFVDTYGRLHVVKYEKPYNERFEGDSTSYTIGRDIGILTNREEIIKNEIAAARGLEIGEDEVWERLEREDPSRVIYYFNDDAPEF